MGRLKALRLGITKGVQHTVQSLNPKQVPAHVAVHTVLSKLKCLECGHASKYHTRRRSLYIGISKADLAKMITATGYPGSGGFMECIYYHCDNCEEEQILAGCSCRHKGGDEICHCKLPCERCDTNG